MMLATGHRVSTIGDGLLIFALYGLYFWRVIKKNPGNRLIECGSLTLIVFLALIPIMNTGNVPDWFFVAWIFLIILLCFTTLFFLFQRIFRALSRRVRS
jgi:hypothetical protein